MEAKKYSPELEKFLKRYGGMNGYVFSKMYRTKQSSGITKAYVIGIPIILLITFLFPSVYTLILFLSSIIWLLFVGCWLSDICDGFFFGEAQCMFYTDTPEKYKIGQVVNHHGQKHIITEVGMYSMASSWHVDGEPIGRNEYDI